MFMIKRKACLLLLLTLIVNYPFFAQTKKAEIQQFLNTKGLEHASIGICVKDFSGRKIASHNADKSLTPASILKVVTTATALELLGPDYRYKTTLAKNAADTTQLLIHGYGDPTLGTAHLKNDATAFLSQWAEQVKQQYDSAATLDIMVIDDYFGYEGISQRWIYQDMGNYYASGTYGISVFDNTYKLYFNTIRKDTCPVIVKTNPEMDIRFHNTMQLNTTGGDNGYIHGVPFSHDRLLTGNIPGGRTSFSIKGDIPDPGLYLGERLAGNLGQMSFNINEVKTTRHKYYQQMYLKDRAGFQEEVFYTHQSFPLDDIIRDTNVRSNNHYAEHLIRTIGRTKSTDVYSSALDLGIEKVNEFWRGKNLDTKSLMMFDGSGLSPSNAVSPEFMCNLLVYMQTKSAYKKPFFESLPKAGKNGTVSNRLKGTRLAGKVSMKSGSIYGVQCFSGYYINGDKKYAFTVMVNKFTGSRSQIVKAIDSLLLSLFD